MAYANDKALDLHALAVLTVYEATAYEPRFRHAKLLEHTKTPDFTLASTKTPKNPDEMLVTWQTVRREHRHGYLFQPRPNGTDEPDTPSDMTAALPYQNLHPSLTGLTENEKEDMFYQARMHDGCIRICSIFQSLLRSYQPDQSILIRDASGTERHTTVDSWFLALYMLHEPRGVCMSIVLPPNPLSIIHGDQARMPHYMFGFNNDDDDSEPTILDLSSMQFHEKGRGQGGEPFWLGCRTKYEKAVLTAAAQKYEFIEVSRKYMNEPREKMAAHANIAESVKERYAKGSKTWCGYCGAPKPPKRCPCGQEYYCDAGHQRCGWSYHKKWHRSSSN